jgi:hypothetical protein
MLFDHTVREIHGLKGSRIAPDAVGVEIEAEIGTAFDTAALKMPGDDWSVKGDGSLRNFGLEFISRPFSPRLEADVLLTSWAGLLSSTHLSSIDHDCPRASVHVHVNVQMFTYTQLYSAILAYLLLEGTLVDYCGRWRRGNLFALRIPEASGNFASIKRAVAQYEFIDINREMRYSAMNLCSLSSFGTIEFRMLGSVYDPKIIHRWASALRHMVDHAATAYRTPVEVYRAYTTLSREEFVEEFLGPLAHEILKRPLKEELFEDGEEYAVELLAASSDDWTQSDDWRNDEDYQKWASAQGYKTNQLLRFRKRDYSSWAQSNRKASDKPVINLGVDWVPTEGGGPLDFNPFAQTPAPSRRERRTAAPRVRVPTAWAEGDTPVLGLPMDIYTASRGQRWIHWAGRLPPEAFDMPEDYETYLSWADDLGEYDARRRADDEGYILSGFVMERINVLNDELQTQPAVVAPDPAEPLTSETLARMLRPSFSPEGVAWVADTTITDSAELRPWASTFTVRGTDDSGTR